MDEDRPAQVSPSLLRRATELCRRRLAHELRGGKRYGNKAADMRFAVSNRIEGDARLAQAELGRPRPEAFVDPRELEPEQRALYNAAARGYLLLFGDDHAQVADLDRSTLLPGLGAELTGSIGLAVERDDGTRELRKISVGGRRANKPLVDEIDLRLVALRTEQWAPDGLHLVAADVIDQLVEPRRIDISDTVDEARAWVEARVTLLFELADDGRARAGADCQGCAFVSGCPAHKG